MHEQTPNSVDLKTRRGGTQQDGLGGVYIGAVSVFHAYPLVADNPVQYLLSSLCCFIYAEAIQEYLVKQRVGLPSSAFSDKNGELRTGAIYLRADGQTCLLRGITTPREHTNRAHLFSV